MTDPEYRSLHDLQPTLVEARQWNGTRKNIPVPSSPGVSAEYIEGWIKSHGGQSTYVTFNFRNPVRLEGVLGSTTFSILPHCWLTIDQFNHLSSYTDNEFKARFKKIPVEIAPGLGPTGPTERGILADDLWSNYRLPDMPWTDCLAIAEAVLAAGYRKAPAEIPDNYEKGYVAGYEDGYEWALVDTQSFLSSRMKETPRG